MYEMERLRPSTHFKNDAEDDSSAVPLLASVADEEAAKPTALLPLARFQRSQKRFWGGGEDLDLDAIATQPSVYDDEETAQLYQPRSDYENLHRFDPRARWTWREEIELVKKIDWKIMVFASIAFMSLELDRANISQALTDNFLEDLGMTTNDYNLGNTVFKLSFLCAELPSQLISKWMGPDRWIPMQMILWSTVAAAQFTLQGRTSFLICRALLGTLQGGFIADMVLYLSYFYTSRELPIRLSYWWTAASLADIIASLLAFVLLHLRGVAGFSGWRWLFLIDGVMSGLVGVMAVFLMPPSPTQTASIVRGKDGWFSPREETIIVTRALRDDPSKGTMHNREAITPSLLIKSLMDYHLWPLYLLGLLFELPMTPAGQYLTINLRRLGYDTFQTNLLVIPSHIGHIIFMVLLTQLASATNQLALTSLLAQLWALPLLTALYLLDPTTSSRWTTWAILTLLLSYPSAHAIQVGWNSRNSNAVRARSVSAAMYNMFVQAGGIAAANVYREDDAPRYRRGNGILLGVAALNVFVYLGIKVFYDGVNRKRARVWDAWSTEEREAYVASQHGDGNKRVDFRFAA